MQKHLTFDTWTEFDGYVRALGYIHKDEINATVTTSASPAPVVEIATKKRNTKKDAVEATKQEDSQGNALDTLLTPEKENGASAPTQETKQVTQADIAANLAAQKTSGTIDPGDLDMKTIKEKAGEIVTKKPEKVHAVKELLKRFGVDTLPDLDPADYSLFYNKLIAL